MSTISEGILAVLESGPKSVSEIYKGVSGKRTSIDKARSRLLKSGKIERVDHGIYGKKTVLGARRRGKISWEKLTDEEKSNYELKVIADVIEDCSELMDTVAYNQNADVVQRLESLSALFQSCTSFTEGALRELLLLKAEWKADPPPGVDDVESLFHGDGSKKRGLKDMIELLFNLMVENRHTLESSNGDSKTREQLANKARTDAG